MSNRRTLGQLASHFIIYGDHLYRLSLEGILLLCVDEIQATKFMFEVHTCVYGPHMSGEALAKKIKRLGYFWLTMNANYRQFVKKYHQCQIHADIIHVPPSELHTLYSLWPFSIWGMDNIGRITPKTSNGHEYILVFIDYFSKWVQAASFSSLDSTKVAKFIADNIIGRFKISHAFVSDNGQHFKGKVLSIMQKYYIQRHMSTAYRPQTNRAVEAANKNINHILKKSTTKSRGWAENLTPTLWAYRTTYRTSTRETPNSLVFGMEVVLPIEIEILTLRVILEDQLMESECSKARFDQLDLLDEKRLRVMEHVQAYQRKMARAFNKRVRPRS